MSTAPNSVSSIEHVVRTLALTAILAAGLAATALTSGCSVDPVENISKTDITQDLAQPVDDLTLALSALDSVPIALESGERVHYYVNKWMQQQDDIEIDEKLDPLLDQLPQSYRNENLKPELKRRVVGQRDVFYLVQCAWMRDIAARAAKEPRNPQWASWLAEQEKTLGIDDTQKLALAERLFDWTVRNIQLDPLPPPPAPPKATTGAGDPASIRASLPAPMRGEIGPGYGQLPWQTLVYGHGDAWERARVFIGLARQGGLDVVMLAVPETEGAGGSRPWLPALLLRGQLYLFDAGLGLPIPGPGGEGIATLEQVVADANLLRALDLPGDDPYPIGPEDLKSVSALIDAELPALSVRMRLLEPAITGKRRMALTSRPSDLGKALRQCKHIAGASLWRVAIEAEIYQATLTFVLQGDPVRRAAHERQAEMFRPGFPLMHARHLHLTGHFQAPQDEESRLGARERYYILRLSDKQIEALRDAKGRELAGLKDLALSNDPAKRQKDIAKLMAIVRASKHHATYWIALTHFESGNHVVAVEWFRDRVLAGAPDSPWHHGARYNLARSYEALGEWDKARQIYLSDDSPQRHGNVLRAISIGQRPAQQNETEAETEASRDESGR